MELYYARTPGRDRIHRMLHAAGVAHTPDEQSEWDLFLPSRGKHYLKDIQNVLPSRTDQWLGALPEYYWISNKANLWNELHRHSPEAAQLMPESWVLNRRADMARLRSSWKPGQQILLKNPHRQQRKGLMFCDDLSAIPDAVSKGFILGQRLAGDLVLIGGRRFHLRIYVLVVRQDGAFSFYIHRDGRVIYAPHPVVLGGPSSWLTRSVGSAVLPAGLPFLLTELAPSMQPVDALIGEVARVLLPRLERAWLFGSNPAMQLFGTDVLLRENGKAYIIEFNMGPDMSARCARDSEMKDRVIADQIACVGLGRDGACWPGGFRRVFSSR